MASLVSQLPDAVLATRESQVCEPVDTQVAVLPDSQLIEHVKDGSRQALGVLFLRYRRLVLAISLRILRNESEAEDVAQDVFLEVCKKAALFDGARGSVKMWILQYAYSRSLDRRRYLALRDSNGQGSNGNGIHAKLSSAYNPHRPDQLTLEERGKAIRKALEALPEKQHQVLEMAYFQGLLMTEIAEATNESLGNVRNQYYRGLKKLQSSLRESRV